MCEDNSTSRLSEIKTCGEVRWAPGYEGHYAVTSNGEVWSLKRTEPLKLKQNTWNQVGHLRACLYLNGKQKNHSVRRPREGWIVWGNEVLREAE